MDNMFFSQAYIQELKTTTDPQLLKLRDLALEKAKKALEIKVMTEAMVTSDASGYASQHENYYQASNPFSANMPLLGFGYLYTGEEAYFEKAKALMLTYAGYKKWHGKGWHGRGELVTEHFNVGMAYGYLYFREKLTEEEKDFIVSNTYRLGILAQLEDWVLPGTKIHAFDTMGHNWWPICASSGALTAIAMKDRLPDGEKLAKIACRSLEAWFAYPGNPINAKPATWDHGAFYESIGYFNYTMRVYLEFAYIYEKLTGNRPFDDAEYIRSASEYFVHTHYPSDEADYHVCFGDGSLAGLQECTIYMLQQCPELNRLRWHVLDCVHSDDAAVFEKLLCYKNVYLLPAEKPQDTAKVYDQIGWAMFRDSFDKNATMLAIKCGDTWNHAHADAGHFILFRNGKPEIYDSENCPYGNPIYVNYYCASPAHNVVLFNGKGQDQRDIHTHARCKGQLYNFVDEPGFKYIAADATGPMGRYFRRHLRHFLWLDGFILIYDDIETYEEGEVNFLLHAEKDNCFRMLTPCTVTECDGYRGHDVTPDQYLSYNQRVDEDCRTKFVSVLLLDESLTPELTEIDGGYKLTCGDTTVYMNILADSRTMHRNCINIMDGIFTDATILVKQGDRYGVVNGSAVRVNGEVKLDTWARVNGWAEGKTPDWLLEK